MSAREGFSMAAMMRSNWFNIEEPGKKAFVVVVEVVIVFVVDVVFVIVVFVVVVFVIVVVVPERCRFNLSECSSSGDEGTLKSLSKGRARKA